MRIERLLTSCCGLGFLPVAPGTWGSVPVAVIFWVMSSMAAAPWVILLVMAALVIAGSVICVRFAPKAIAMTGKKDPGEVVADELAGQAVTFLVATAFIEGPVTITALAGFIAFRILDVLKPWPIKKLEKFADG